MENALETGQLVLPFLPRQFAPRTLADVHRTTVYRLAASPDRDGLRRALNSDYLAERHFEETEVTIAGAPALLVHGAVPCEEADWCEIIGGLTGVEVAIGYSTAGSAILIAVDDVVYGLAYGHVGRHLFRADVVEPGFGIDFAIRSIDPDAINGIQRRVFDARGRVDHNSVLGGQPIRAYSVEIAGEIVGQIKGALAARSALSATRLNKRPPAIAGGTSLRVPLSTDAAGLVADLREITRICATASPDPELEFIAQVQPVKPGLRTAQLDEALDLLLGQDDPTDLGLALPSSVSADAGSFRIAVPGFRPVSVADIELADLLRTVRTRGDGKRLNALKTGTIGIEVDGQPDVTETPAHRWLTAEIAAGAARMIYIEGRWYEIGERYLDTVRAEVTAILTAPSSVTLPPWTAAMKTELAYNTAAASTPGYLCLDQDLVRTGLHRRGKGIEMCDLLGPDDELIHVKRADRSSLLSHLFTQGVVSFEALQNEERARQRFAERVTAVSGGARVLPEAFVPKKVVYAIALKSGRKLTTNTLFTFAQVAMRRAVRQLRGAGVAVEVVTITP